MEQALKNAISAELAGARFYQTLTRQTVEPVRDFFLEMSKEEAEHAAVLREVASARGRDLPPVLEVEKREPFDLGASDQDIQALGLSQAVDLAWDLEQDAIATYSLLAAETQGETRALFMAIAATEERHARILEDLRKTL